MRAWFKDKWAIWTREHPAIMALIALAVLLGTMILVPLEAIWSVIAGRTETPRARFVQEAREFVTPEQSLGQVIATFNSWPMKDKLILFKQLYENRWISFDGIVELYPSKDQADKLRRDWLLTVKELNTNSFAYVYSGENLSIFRPGDHVRITAKVLAIAFYETKQNDPSNAVAVTSAEVELLGD